jgi:hypothetical protein
MRTALEARAMTGEGRFDTREGYEIQIGGILDERWSDWFNGLAVSVGKAGDGTRVTTLTGVLDNSALHGILARIRDLNLRLISVIQTGLPESKPHTQQGGK